jgi:DNA end-binding protein Ku
VGIATFVMRSKESLAILRSSEQAIILNRIRFAEEVRDPSELHLPEKPEIKKGELEMAISLINQLSSKFDITAYKDTYTAQLLSVIEAKSKGETVAKPKMRVVHSAKEDLMSQLKASLSATPVKKKKAS